MRAEAGLLSQVLLPQKRQNGFRRLAGLSGVGNSKSTLPIGYITICNILIHMLLLHNLRMLLPYTVDT
jgi:hypothetical protein